MSFDSIFLMLLIIWGLPLGWLRSKFRKKVYQTDSSWININPIFIKEVKALFVSLYPEDEEYLQMSRFYGFYLLVYLSLLFTYIHQA